MNYFKYIFIALLFITACSINKIEKDPYEGALKIAKNYFEYNDIPDDALILFYSKNAGCASCKKHVFESLEKMNQNKNIYIITNNSTLDFISSPRMVYDSLDLMDITDLGFYAPTLLIKKGEKLEYVIEIDGVSRTDSFDKAINQFNK